MKKLFFALAIVCSMQAAFAQKPDADMQKAVDKALAAAQDAKKATKPATWTALGKAYMTAYQNPTSNVTPGIDKTTFGMMVKERPSAVENVEIDGKPYEKQVFSHYNVYFNAAGILTITEVTRPSVQGDLLGEAAKAYAKAFELGAKDKEVDPMLQQIAEAYYNDAFTAYQLGDVKKASDLFKGAADVSVMPGCTVRNDDAAYNAAFTALAIKDYDRADEYYKKCLANNYTSEGNIYASLSDVALAKADTVAAKQYLATGLTAYPDNASILTNLINLYLATNEDPAKIVGLLDEAKKAMPDNPSLYYVEGNIYMGIADYEKALAAYDKGIEINPNYDMSYYGKANVALKQADALIDAREALDVREYKKYDEYTAQVIDLYKGAIAPFEKCYEVSQIPEVKAAAADFLKRLNFQLRNEDPKFQADYEKWNEIVNNAQ
jgi:tetratricopeptide (TPR) repeat protein